MRKVFTITILICMMLIASIVWGKDIYVATEGDDDKGDGSPDNPYKTIQKGIDAAKDGDRVLIADGKYSYGYTLKPEMSVLEIYCGKNHEAVIMLHGFIASQYEVSYLAKFLNGKGYTVFLPLVKGFGGDTKAANASTSNRWRETLTNSLNLLNHIKPHFDKVHLIGFSLGGTIISDFVLNELNHTTNSYEGIKVESIILLAPYYRQKNPRRDGLGLWFCGLIQKSSISLKNRLLRNHPDLCIPISLPKYYNKDMPLKAARTLRDFGQELRDLKENQKVNIPTLLVITENDETVDNDCARDFLNKHFLQQSIFPFEKKDKVRHQLVFPKDASHCGNKRFDELCSMVVTFIREKRIKR